MVKMLLKGLSFLPIRNDRGGIMIEFGFAMPVLILLMLGGVELGRYVLLHQKLDRTAMTVSDLVARVTTVTPAELDTIFTAANLVMTPFALEDKGTVVISSVIDDGGPQVAWQRSGAGTLSVTSEIGTQGGSATLSDEALVETGSGIIVGETYFDYTPWFITLIPTTRLHHIAVYRPRLTGEIVCTGC
jgi:Flp pilus assembly protein TadG